MKFYNKLKSEMKEILEQMIEIKRKNLVSTLQEVKHFSKEFDFEAVMPKRMGHLLKNKNLKKNINL